VSGYCDWAGYLDVPGPGTAAQGGKPAAGSGAWTAIRPSAVRSPGRGSGGWLALARESPPHRRAILSSAYNCRFRFLDWQRDNEKCLSRLTWNRHQHPGPASGSWRVRANSVITGS